MANASFDGSIEDGKMVRDSRNKKVFLKFDFCECVVLSIVKI